MATTRSFQDHDFLVWEVYASGGRFGFSDNPHVVFHCLTQPAIRPRVIELGRNEADAERMLREMSSAELVELLEGAPEIA
jgi:hypothetical protein